MADTPTINTTTTLGSLNRAPILEAFLEGAVPNMCCPGCNKDMVEATVCCEIDDEKHTSRDKAASRLYCAHTICIECFDARVHMEKPGNVDNCRFCVQAKNDAPSEERAFMPIGDPKKRRAKNAAYTQLAQEARKLIDAEEDIRRREVEAARAPVEAERRARAEATRERRRAVEGDQEEEQKRNEEADKLREEVEALHKEREEAQRQATERERERQAKLMEEQAVAAERAERAEEEQRKKEAKHRKEIEDAQRKAEAEIDRAKRKAEKEAEKIRRESEAELARVKVEAEKAEERARQAQQQVPSSSANKGRKRKAQDPEVVRQRIEKTTRTRAENKRKLEHYDELERERALLDRKLEACVQAAHNAFAVLGGDLQFYKGVLEKAMGDVEHDVPDVEDDDDEVASHPEDAEVLVADDDDDEEDVDSMVVATAVM